MFKDVGEYLDALNLFALTAPRATRGGNFSLLMDYCFGPGVLAGNDSARSVLAVGQRCCTRAVPRGDPYMGGAGLRHPKKRDLPAGRAEARSVWQAIVRLRAFSNQGGCRGGAGPR
jgi:hypothetical protein